jgi:omega-amidase
LAKHAQSLLINVDGGSRGNPGPSGCGVVIRDAASKDVLYEAGLFLGRATNNVAEYSGLLAGLQVADQCGATAVIVISDSELLVRQMTGKYRVKSPNLLEIYAQACELAGKFSKCSFRHVMREDNTQADELANLAMDRKRNIVRTDNLSQVSQSAKKEKASTCDQAPPLPFGSAAGQPKIFCVQFDIVWEDKAANFAKVSAMLAGESIAPGSLIALPEMFATGFDLNVDVAAQSRQRESELFLSQLAVKYKSTVIGGLANLSSAGKGLNQAITFSPDGKELSSFTKLHSFSYAGEHEHFAAGQSVEIFEWNNLRASPFICYDLRFPEAFRRAVAKGANLFIVPANWPIPREEHWLTLLKARAIENQAYVVGVNRCGASPHNTYGGASRIISPQGVILAQAGKDEAVISATVDPAGLAAYRNEFPALKDIKPLA